MTSTPSAAGEGLPKVYRQTTGISRHLAESQVLTSSYLLPAIPPCLELALYGALALIVGTAWAGVLTVCWWGVS